MKMLKYPETIQTSMSLIVIGIILFVLMIPLLRLLAAIHHHHKETTGTTETEEVTPTQFEDDSES